MLRLGALKNYDSQLTAWDKNYPQCEKRISASERGRKIAIRFIPMRTASKTKSALFLKLTLIEFE